MVSPDFFFGGSSNEKIRQLSQPMMTAPNKTQTAIGERKDKEASLLHFLNNKPT